MNIDQINGILRIIIPTLCGLLATFVPALGDQAIIAQITTAVLAVGAVIWSIMATTNAAKITAAAAVDKSIKITVPEHVMIADPAVAAVVKDATIPNVVALKPA